MSFYNNIQGVCSQKGISVSALCTKCGYSTVSATYWKKGSYPKIDVVDNLATELGVSTDRLIRGTIDPDSLPDDELKILNLYRMASNQDERDRILNAVKGAIPKRDIKCYHDKVSAGTGVELESSGYDTRQVYLDNNSRKADFLLIVNGESMSPKFHDGDALLVKNIDHSEIEIGQIGVFVIDNEGFVKELGADRLISLNPKHKDIFFSDHEQIERRGLVIGKAQLIE